MRSLQVLHAATEQLSMVPDEAFPGASSMYEQHAFPNTFNFEN